MTVRVGHIEFLNCYPLYFGLENRGTLANGHVFGAEPTAIELIPGVPTDLNRMLAASQIDIGPISSIAYARDHRRLLLSRRLSISSFGAVDSIQLVSKKPWEQIETVALTSQSATSVVLLKTILKLRYERDVTYRELSGSLAEGLTECDAVLLIGDQALDALHFPEGETTCYDLGEAWLEWTGLPMVYAVWAAREEFAQQDGAHLLAVEDELVKCIDYGRQHASEVVAGAAGRSRFDEEQLDRYFEALKYDFPPLYQQGLRRFYELAHQIGELDEVPEFRFLDEAVTR